MSKPPRSQPDPLAREVNRLLAQLEHSGPRAAHNGSAPHDQTPTPRPAPLPKSPRVGTSSSSPDRRGLIALWGRVLLSVGLGAVMTQWPYAHGCGLPLLGYAGAVSMVMLAAAWIGFSSWRLRRGLPHILSLILFFWGIVLAAEQLLPRIGYAAESAAWRCAVKDSLPVPPRL
jgi:hypothetical protein